MSGSGKHTVSNALEDLGYFCVDNIPSSLIQRLLQMVGASGGQISKIAAGVDVRFGQSIAGFGDLVSQLQGMPFQSTICFVDASNRVLARRYSTTRRVHPLGHDRTLLEAIQTERRQLAEIRALADLVVDTSDFTVHDLRRHIHETFTGESQRKTLKVSVVSFGFKFGLPFNADLVFDVRFLPNPYFVSELRDLTGNDPVIVDYMKQFKDTQEIQHKILDLLNYLIPKYADEGKTYLTIAVGCTGGRHRSVMLANELHAGLQSFGVSPNLIHRDLYRDD